MKLLNFRVIDDIAVAKHGVFNRMPFDTPLSRR